VTHPDDQNPFPNDIDAAEMEKAIEKVKLRFVEDNVDEIVDLAQIVAASDFDPKKSANTTLVRIYNLGRNLRTMAYTYIDEMRSGVDRTDDE
jgi:hypothetical protein